MTLLAANSSGRFHALIVTMGVLLFLAGTNPMKAQNVNTGKGQLVEAKLTWKGTQMEGDIIHLQYDIPFNGVVELRLFDEKGGKVWQNYYVNNFGENKISLRRSKFKAGESYTCVLNYKTDEVRAIIVIPPGETP